VIHFGVDPCQRLADGNGNPLWETAWLGDLPVAALSPAGRFYIAPDHLGSPHRIIDTGGAVVWHWNPDPFGNGDPSGSFTYELRFPGQYFDQATRLHYNYFRDYDPRLGRYIESDPIGLAGGVNTYAYVRNNPLKFTDPRGLAPADPPGSPGTDNGPSCGPNEREANQRALLLARDLLLQLKPEPTASIAEIQQWNSLASAFNQDVRIHNGQCPKNALLPLPIIYPLIAIVRRNKASYQEV
jgi:RHS repeat-associated protein